MHLVVYRKKATKYMVLPLVYVINMTVIKYHNYVFPYFCQVEPFS